MSKPSLAKLDKATRQALRAGNGLMSLFYLENVTRVSVMLANYRARVEGMRLESLRAWGRA